MASPATPRVVIVDDEGVIASTLVLILGRSGLDAVGFQSPIAALEHLQTDRLDLLISDVRMPEMSGVDLAMEVKTLHPMTKILLISGMGAINDLTLDPREKGHDFPVLTKPVHPKDLLGMAHALTS